MTKRRCRRRGRRGKRIERKKSKSNSDVEEVEVSCTISSASSPASKLWSKVVSGEADKLLDAEVEIFLETTVSFESEEVPVFVRTELEVIDNGDFHALATILDDEAPRREGIYLPPPLRRRLLDKGSSDVGKSEVKELPPETDNHWNPWNSVDFLAETFNLRPHSSISYFSTSSGVSELEDLNTYTCSIQLEVTLCKTINLTSVPIQFIVKVRDGSTYFSRFQVTQNMFDAVAVSPTGTQRIPCWLDKGANNCFQGNFTVAESNELGMYKLKVTLRLMKIYNRFQTDYKEVVSVTDVLIGRNYTGQRCRKPANTFPLNFSTPEDREAEVHSELGGTWGIAYDKLTDRIFYTDPGGHCVNCIDPSYSPNDGVLFRLSRTDPNYGSQQFPMGISCDMYHRRLAVCDRGSHQVDLYSLNTGEYLSSFGGFGKHTGTFESPCDVAVTRDGTHIVVTDPGNMKIQLFDRQGHFIRDRGALPNPRGVCFDSTNNILLTDTDTRTVTEITLDCKSSRKLVPLGNSFFQSPEGLVQDTYGGVLVADSKNNCVQYLDVKDGNVISTIPGKNDYALEYPVNVTVMRGEYLAVLGKKGKLDII